MGTKATARRSCETSAAREPLVHFTRDAYYATAFALSWTAGFLPVFLRRPGWTWPRAVGLALVALPYSLLALGFLDDALRTFERYQATGTVFQVLQPAAALALWRSLEDRLLWYLLLPIAGLVLVHRAWSKRDDIIIESGLAPRDSWGRDLARGLALFFALAIAYIAAYAIQAQLPATATGADESRYWANLTIPLMIALSIVPAITEEFLFRGVLFRALQARMDWRAAALVQALFFGLVHAGYGSWTHVVAPFAFGLGMAWVAREIGWTAAAVLHTEINTLFFVLDRWQDHTTANGVGGLATLLAILVGAGAWALWRTKGDEYRILWSSLKRRVLSRSAA